MNHRAHICMLLIAIKQTIPSAHRAPELQHAIANAVAGLKGRDIADPDLSQEDAEHLLEFALEVAHAAGVENSRIVAIVNGSNRRNIGPAQQEMHS